MRIYLNPRFSRYSFDKSNNNSDNKMRGKSLKYNHACNTSNGSTDECKKSNQETFDMEDVYAVEDSLTMKYVDKKKKSYLLPGLICMLLLIILTGAISYVVVHFLTGGNSRNTKTENCTTCGSEKTRLKLIGDVFIDIRNHTYNTSEVCTTDKCFQTADSLKKAMNFSTDPCENFHEFSCGLWPKSHPLPASMSKLDTMSLLNLNKNIYLKDMIERETSRKKLNSKGFKNKILTFYRSCMNLNLIDKRGQQPLLQFISEFGRWSPIKIWQNRDINLDITSLLVMSHQYFTSSVYDDRVKSPLFKGLVKVNDVNSKEHIYEINIPDLPISDYQIYLSKSKRAETVRAKYKLLQTNYVALLGPADDAKNILEELMKFETKLANISNAATYVRHAMLQYNLTTIKDLQAYIGDEIDWLRFFRETLSPSGIKITENTKVGVRFIKFIKKIHDLIKETPKQLVKDYIIWVCVWKFGSYASAPFREAEFNFKQGLLGIQERPKRWNRCIVDLEETMEFGLASLYVEKALSNKDRNLAKEIVLNITREFKRTLVNVEWMDVTTKASAFAKATSIKFNIGYPDYVKNHTYLDIKYEKTRINAAKYFESAINMYKEKRNSNLMLLPTKVDRAAYDLPPTLVEAYFDPNKNKMVFLAGILHMPFYDTLAPMALNYGALGLVVGHEITHAFDDAGRSFDGNGERKNWWTKSSSLNFKKRSDCIVKQYSNYTLYGLNVDGKFTLGENLADNGGIKVAYAAYKEWEGIHGMEKKLPGIPLTMEQLFFVSMGQIWCGSYREEYAKNALNIDYHSPAKYRIIGPLSNLKAFSEAFHCKKGSTMNPVKKCRVW